MKLPFFSSPLLNLLKKVSILGLALGVAALMVVMSVVGGFEEQLYKSTISYLAPIVAVKTEINEQDMVAIKKDCQDCRMIKYKTGNGVIVHGLKSSYIKIEAFNLDNDLQIHVGMTPHQGKWAELDDEIVLGTSLGKKIGIHLGEDVQILKESLSQMESKTYKVVGFHSFGYQKLDERVALISDQSMAESLEGMRDGLKIYPLEEDEKLYRKLNDKFEYPWIIRHWKDFNSNLISAIVYEKFTLFMVLTFIVLMAVLNISSTVLTLVFEKRSAFSLFRALGMRKKQMIQYLVGESLWISCKGICGGLILGVVFILFLKNFPLIQIPAEIYGFETLPVSFNVSMVITIFVFSMGFAFLGAFIPSVFMATRPIAEGLVRE